MSSAAADDGDHVAAEVAGLAGRLVRDSGPTLTAEPFAAAGLLDRALPQRVQVEVAAQLGRAGIRAALNVLGIAPERHGTDLRVAAALVGAGQEALDIGAAYAGTRVVFGQPLARNAVQRNVFAAATADLAAALALVRRCAWQLDAGTADPVEAAACLRVSADAAWRAVETALQVHGGNGYSEDYPISQRWRDMAEVCALLPQADGDRALAAAAATLAGPVVEKG